MSSREELESAYKKALKSLEGEKRAATKKAKGTKGKKAKEAIAAVETEYAAKLQELERNHQEKLKALEGGSDGHEGGESEAAPAEKPTETTEDPEQEARERKMEKARRKREKQKEKEAQKQRELEEEEANAGPSMRQVELDQIQVVLTPLNLRVEEVEADGHCLYRAVAAQTNQQYPEIRALCADTLQAHQDDFAPFCEYDDKVTTFDEYVERVRNSAEWGGHLELRALGMALQRPILIYSLQSGAKPVHIHDESKRNDNAIVLSYHLHYYALGEHYNQVVKA